MTNENEFDWAKLSDVKAGAAPTEASQRKLEKAIQTLKAKDAELDEKCKLVALAAEAAGLGLAFPSDLRDSTEAYRWLTSERQKLGRHTSSPSMLDASHQIRTQHLAPLQQERQACQSLLKELEQQRHRIKNELDFEGAPQQIEKLGKQIKLLDASRKKHQENVDRLNSDLGTLRLELADLGIAEQEADEKLALAVAAGTPVDDNELTAMAASKAAKTKRLQITQQAHQKALEAVKADRQSIDQHQSEISRLKALIRSNQIRGALREVVDKLVKDGHPKSIVLEHIKAFI